MLRIESPSSLYNQDDYLWVIPKLLVIVKEEDEELLSAGFPTLTEVAIKRTPKPEKYRILFDSTQGKLFASLEDVGRPRHEYTEQTIFHTTAGFYPKYRKYINLSDTDLMTLKLMHS